MGPSPSPVWSEGLTPRTGMVRTLCGLGWASTDLVRCVQVWKAPIQETLRPALVEGVWFGQPRSSQGHWVEGFPAGAGTQDRGLSSLSPPSLPVICY